VTFRQCPALLSAFISSALTFVSVVGCNTYDPSLLTAASRSEDEGDDDDTAPISATGGEGGDGPVGPTRPSGNGGRGPSTVGPPAPTDPSPATGGEAGSGGSGGEGPAQPTDSAGSGGQGGVGGASGGGSDGGGSGEGVTGGQGSMSSVGGSGGMPMGGSGGAAGGSGGVESGGAAGAPVAGMGGAAAGGAAGGGGSAGTDVCGGCARLTVPLDASDDWAHFVLTLPGATDLTAAVITFRLARAAGTGGSFKGYVQQGSSGDFAYRVGANTPLASIGETQQNVEWDLAGITDFDLAAITRIGIEVTAAGGSSWSNPTVLLLDSVQVSGAAPALESWTFDDADSVNTTPVETNRPGQLWLNSFDTTAAGSAVAWFGP
jgi:hypothetical protein